jgi:predicted negative regulator of RcsB-dependent stress response
LAPFSTFYRAFFSAMKRLILIVLLAVIGWQGYNRYQARQLALANAQEDTAANDSAAAPRSPVDAAPSTSFKCDGRTYCSQMTSCEEAKFFLRNCPGVKMDGDNDGIPCETQWCK